MRTGPRVLLTLAVVSVWQAASADVRTVYTAEELQIKAAGAAETGSEGRPDAGREGGPDANGYFWRQTGDIGGPAISWVDATASGTNLGITGDDATNVTPVTLPWTFTFYGVGYTAVRAVSNGFLNLGASSTAYSNTALPAAAAPNAIVAPFWDDLTSSTHGSVWYWYDSVNDQAVFEWFEVPRLSGGTNYNTFEVILRPDGTMLFQYLTMAGVLNSATVGIENATGTVGLQAHLNGVGSLITSGHALEIVQYTGDIVAPVIVHTALGNQVGDTAPFEVSATVTDASGVAGVDLIYNTGAGDVTVGMTNTSGDVWESSIPGQAALTTVTYRIRAVDQGNNSLPAISGPTTFVVLDAIAAFPYQQNFDAFANLAFPFTEQWANSVGNNSWHAGISTPSTLTGASADHTSGTGKFIYCESNNGTTGNLYTVSSPFFDLDLLATPLLKFWYHMCGATTGTLNVDVYDVASATWTLGAWSLTGSQQALESTPWLEASVPLDAFTGVVQLRFRGVRGTGTTGDMSVDDVFLGEAPSFDVALDVDSFTSPVSALGNLDVAVTVTNVGATTADVDVELDYDGAAGADDQVQIFGLAPAASQQVFFTPAAPAAGTYAYTVEAVVTNGTDGLPADNTESGSYDVFDSSLPPSGLVASADQLDQISLSWTAPAWVVALVGDLRPREITVADLPFTLPADAPADKVAAVLAEYEAAHPQWQFENASRAFLNYNIYRDGNLVGTAAGLTFVDNLANGVVINMPYDYTVTALWDEEESAASNTDSGMAVGRPTAGGPDALGYTWVNSNDPADPATFDWVEISGIGTNLGITADDGIATQALPFAFPFYTGAFPTVSVCANGFLNFGSSSSTWTNTVLPNVSLPNNVIYAFWEDQNPFIAGSILYYDDSATNNRVIFQWNGVARYQGNASLTYTYQVVLNSDGTFKVQYLDMNDIVSNATVGCENGDGTIALQVNALDNGGAIADGVAVAFSPGTGDFIAPDILHTQTITSIETEQAGDYTFSATITDDSGVASADLTYNNGNGAAVVPMTHTIGDTWEADIPHQLAGLTVTYSISATDAGPNSNSGSTGNYSFTVVSVSWIIDDVVASDGLYGQTNITWTAPGAPAPAPVHPGSLDEKAQALYDARLRELADAGRAFLNYNIHRDGNLIGSASTSPFIDTALLGAVEGVEYTYTVTSLYTSGESPASSGDPGSFVARPTSGGPDAFGNMWWNSEDANGPAYGFTDISGDPNAVAVTLTDDSATGAIAMGIDFLHYGVAQDTCFISSNGHIAFSAASSSLGNTVLPTSGEPNNIVALFWDDLNPSNGGTIHYLSDVTNNRFIVQYTNVPEYGTSGNLHTFQGILEADGSVLINYALMTPGDLDEATVGIENADGSDGLTVNFDNVGGTLLDGTSIRIGLPQAAPVPVLTIVRNPGNTVTLNWSDEGYSSYNVYSAPNGYGPFTLLGNVAGTTATYVAAPGRICYHVVGVY